MLAQYTMTLMEILENNVNIFDFDYPMFEESYKPVFEQKFKDRFLFDEIGVETVARFKHNLKQMLNLIMPFYNKLYMSQGLEQRILDNYDVTEKFTRTTNTNKLINSDGENKNLFSATPGKRIDINTNDFVTNITKDITTGSNAVKDDGTETWIRTMQGNIGVQTDADAIKKYEEVLRNVDEEILNKLEVLFMGVY